MLKKKRIVVAALAVLVALGFLSIDAFAQSRKKLERRLLLNRAARINGYIVTNAGRREYPMQITGATDPKTGRRLSGELDVELRCREITERVIRKFLFENGNAGRDTPCLEMLVRPTIIILDEDD